jgi:hypothetical protein
MPNPFERAPERERECPQPRGSGESPEGKPCRPRDGKGIILVR